MLDPFQLPFMQRAALEILLLAPLAGLLGAQIVLRHLAFFTHGVGAAAFPGLVLAGPAGIPPALAALGVGGGFAGAARAARPAARSRLRRGDGTAARERARRRASSSPATSSNPAAGSTSCCSDRCSPSATRSSMDGCGARGRPGGARATSPAAPGSRPASTEASTARWACGSLASPTGSSRRDHASRSSSHSTRSARCSSARSSWSRPRSPGSSRRSVPELEVGAAAARSARVSPACAIAYELDVPPGATIAVLGGAVFVVAWRCAALAGARTRGVAP